MPPTAHGFAPPVVSALAAPLSADTAVAADAPPARVEACFAAAAFSSCALAAASCTSGACAAAGAPPSGVREPGAVPDGASPSADPPCWPDAPSHLAYSVRAESTGVAKSHAVVHALSENHPANVYPLRTGSAGWSTGLPSATKADGTNEPPCTSNVTCTPSSPFRANRRPASFV